MTQRQFDSLKATLEDAIDISSTITIAEAIAEVCHDKADHISYAWQDKPSAAHWRSQALHFEHVADLLAADTH